MADIGKHCNYLKNKTLRPNLCLVCVWYIFRNLACVVLHCAGFEVLRICSFSDYWHSATMGKEVWWFDKVQYKIKWEHLNIASPIKLTPKLYWANFIEELKVYWNGRSATSTRLMLRAVGIYLKCSVRTRWQRRLNMFPVFHLGNNFYFFGMHILSRSWWKHSAINSSRTASLSDRLLTFPQRLTH